MASSASSSLSDYHGQLTPPSSPDAPRQQASRHGSRLQISKLLRRPRLHKRIQIRHSIDPLDWPFVSMMKAPLILPESPMEIDCSSTSTVSSIEPPQLRRVSASYQDLRSVAAQWTASKPSQPTTPLLPSPITHELFEQGEAYFQFHDPRLPPADGGYKSYDDLHILSCYYDDSRTESMLEIERALDDDNVSEPSLDLRDADNNSPTSEGIPHTPRNRPFRATCSSDESGWLANSTTPSERMRRFKSRCYQVVQHPMHYKRDKKDENELMLATLVVGQGKPKLVQISRPTSKASSRDSGPEQPPAPPQTPVQYPQEISAFSPYDTPGDAIEERLQCTTTARRLSTPGLGLSYSSTSLLPPPLSLVAQAQSYQSSSTAFSNTQQHLQNLADTFGSAVIRRSMSPPEARQSITALPTYPVDGRHASSNSQQSFRLPPTHEKSPQPTLSSHSRRSAHEMSPRKKLTRNLAVITSAINNYTIHSSFSGSTALSALHLFSPAIMDLRCHDIPESQYISILGKIFPTVLHIRRSKQSGEDLLSALAAWIIVDLYLCKAMTGMQAARNSVNRTTPISQIQRKPVPTMHPSDHNNHEQHYSYTTLINQSNSSLHRIPTKARDLLGITLSPTPHRRSRCPGNSPSSPSQHDTALLHRTIAVQQSVAVIGQKLVEMLRGGLGFDKDIWRSLRVLVEVVEEGGRARKSIEDVRCTMSDPSDYRSEIWV